MHSPRTSNSENTGTENGAEHDRQWVTRQIELAIAEPDPGPVAVRSLRYLAREHPAAFFDVAAKYLESDEESPSDRMLAELLLGLDSLFERLVNPARCSCQSAVTLFRRLLAFDPTLDFRLARMLPGRNDSSNDRTLTGGHAARALDILDETSPGQRLLSVVGHLPNSSDARISAKAALFVGHRIRSRVWLEKQLDRADPRLRANAVESVWGSKADNAIRILEDCAEDPNPRVAGNALIGLHMAGSPDVTVKAMAMAVSEDPGRRSAAAWVMGKIGGSECIECLKALLRDSNPPVRSTAVRSLAEISRAESKRLQAQAKAAKPDAPQLAAQTHAQTAVEPDAPDAASLPDYDLRLDGSFVVGKNVAGKKPR